MPIIDLSGQRFGKLVVIGKGDRRGKYYEIYWVCKCECGNSKEIVGNSLKNNLQKSCGCDKSKTQFKKTHGLITSHEYRSWQGMKARCKDLDGTRVIYTKKGIKVCDRWINSFESFLEDMGAAPSKLHTIDRINNAGNYEPGNCRWATKTQQNRNLDTNRILTYNGKSLCVAEWADLSGVHQNLFYNRLAAGWSTEKTISTPKAKYTFINRKRPSRQTEPINHNH